MNRSKAAKGHNGLWSNSSRVALRCMWRRRIIPCRIFATSLLAGLTSTIAAAQQSPPTEPPVATPQAVVPPSSIAPPTTGNTSSPEVAMNAYKVADGWIRTWDSATGPDGPPLTAAAITLRMHNRIVGRGRAFATGAPDAGVLRRAVAEAMSETERRRPVSADALGLAQRVTDAADIAISVEIAGPLVPFEPATFAEVDLVVQAGLEGVAVRIDEKLTGVFPAAMLLSGGSPADAVCGAISEASGDPMLAIKSAAPSQPAALRKSHGVRLYRFAVTHLAQLTAKSQPSFLVRSQRLIEQQRIDGASLAKLRTTLAANLRTRVVSLQNADGSEILQVVGPYSASRGPATANAAPPETMAIVALAMRLHAVNSPIDSAEREDFEWLSGELARSAMQAQTPMSIVTAASVVACMAAECAVNSQTRTTFEPAFEVLLTAIDEKGTWHASVPDDRRGLVAFGLASEATRGGALERAGPYRTRANAAIVSVMKEASTVAMSANMPWLYFADRELRRDDASNPASPTASRTTAFLAFRDGMWNSQMTVDDAGDEGPDLVGGFAFNDPRSPLPTALGLRVLPFFAAMLADPAATREEERLPQLIRILRSARFLHQLTTDEWSGYSAADPKTAFGGVRAAFWDDTLDPETQAIALLSMDEIAAALRLMAAPVNPAPSAPTTPPLTPSEPANK